MTSTLEKAISQVQTLPEADQNAIADLILSEVEDRKRWDEKFADSQDALAQIAKQVRSDIQAGRVRQLGIDEL